MKQTPLKRRTLLGRGKRRRLSKKEREAARLFREAGMAQWCAGCGGHHGYADVHHVVAAQWLRANAPKKVYDARNALAVCRDCHERHENGSRKLSLSALTESNLEFAREVLGEAADDYLRRRYA